MRQHRLCGYDLNGWRDIAARNWIVRPGEDVEIGETVITEGGILGSVVQTGAFRSGPWIGGIQAALAPHRLGGGWGSVGHVERRVSVRDCLDTDAPDAALVSTGIDGLASGARCAVLAIPDREGITESYREALLAAMDRSRIRSRLLVWRPVLATLWAIRQLDLQAGQNVAVICHSANGLTVQSLKIRLEAGSHDPVLAPERRANGHELASEAGYNGLTDQAERAIRKGLDERKWEAVRHARAIGHLAIGLVAEPEVLRLGNGDWLEVAPPPRLTPPNLGIASDAFSLIAGADIVLLETLTEGHIRTQLQMDTELAVGQRITVLPHDAVARGALIAAERLCGNDPVYFDFLPRISTIVQGRDGAQNFDLIDKNETLPAGRMYRSPIPARLGIQQGQDAFSVYLLKEAEDRPRKAQVEIGQHVSGVTPVELWVEQVPAAGRARIALSAPDIGRQFVVDWGSAEPQDQSWEEIIASLETTRPTIPNRMVLPCGTDAWEDKPRRPGLSRLLRDNVGRLRVDWGTLRAALSARPFGRYCVSSDGEIPSSIDDGDVAHLDRLTARAIEDVRARLAGRGTDNNDSLNFLTWQFRRCPSEVSDWLLETWVARSKNQPHPFVDHHMSWTLMYQGAGRVATTPEHQRLAFDRLFLRDVADWDYRQESACMSFLLSRSDDAPTFLERDRVDTLAARVVSEFRSELGSRYTRFSYAPMLLVGLLRWRLKEPYALVACRDPVATKLAIVVDHAIEDIERRRGDLPNRIERTLKILQDTKEELAGHGTNPDLLLDIYMNA